MCCVFGPSNTREVHGKAYATVSLSITDDLVAFNDDNTHKRINSYRLTTFLPTNGQSQFGLSCIDELTVVVFTIMPESI